MEGGGDGMMGLVSRSISVAIFVKKDVIFFRVRRVCLTYSHGGILRGRKWERKLTGLVNHLLPPHSNQPRCPPQEVVHMTPYGVFLISLYGSASFTEIYFCSDGK